MFWHFDFELHMKLKINVSYHRKVNFINSVYADGSVNLSIEVLGLIEVQVLNSNNTGKSARPGAIMIFNEILRVFDQVFL